MSKKGFTYELKIEAEINDLIAKTNQVKQSMQSIINAGKAPGAEKMFSSIEKALDKLQNKASQPIETVAAFESLKRDAADVGLSLGKLGAIIEKLGKMDLADKMDLIPPNLKKQIEDANKAIENFAKAEAQAAKKSQELAQAETDLIKAEKERKKAEGKASEKTALIQATKAEIEEINKKREALKKFLETQKAYEEVGANKNFSGDKTGKAELRGKSLPADRAAAKQLVPDLDLKDIEAVEARIESLGVEIEKAEQAQKRYETSFSEWSKKTAIASQSVNELQNQVNKLNAEFEQNKVKDTQAAYAKLRTEAEKLGINLSNIPIEYTTENYNQLKEAMEQLALSGIEQVNTELVQIQTNMDATNVSAQAFGTAMSSAGDNVKKLDETVSNTTAFTQRIAQFVGLQGGIQLARKAMRSAISTIKELDAVMTEMAVVTDLEIGDYWNQLPEHTKRANELGVAIKDVYEAETLYYQQGLKTAEAQELANTTLKMARIAGLDAADATDKMTAALRGFNMELNETSAEKVADVYSELAAITAADVEEISSAMTKTASIASSAGMEFETTAAFLSQIIETTRESAETAGTAMKTVIARFQELKKDPSEIGEIDGEIVDANKIETALRSVGVSLRDAQGQFRDLDEVFLELSSKWNTLDTNTQRYIATIAAGSRQQSRFIAMMSDYGRTQELVSAANNSAGASQKQYEKTLDSLATKLTELSNAWKTFTMGLVDNELIKTGIDLLTGLLTALNNFTDLFGEFSGAAKITTLVIALYLGDKALNVFTKSLKEGNTIFQSFAATGKGTFKAVGEDVEKLKNKFHKASDKAKQMNDNVAKMKATAAQQSSATNGYTNALNRQIQAQTTISTLEQQGITSGSAYATAKAMQIQATLDLGSETNRLKAAYSLTNEELDDAIRLTQAGITIDAAAVVAKDKKTMAILREKGALDNLNDEASQNLVLEQTDLLLDGADNVNSFGKSLQGLATKLQNFNMTEWFDGVKAGLKGVGKGFLDAAKSVGSFLLSIWPVLVAIAAIAAAIALLVLWFKHLKETSPEGKLKSAKEAAEQAGKAADAAAESYNKLNDSLNSLNDKYKGIKELTKGTKEWREAVHSINDEVLNLITDYPELAGMFENVDGVLTIKAGMEDDVENVLKQKELEMIQANSAELAAKANVVEAENNVAYKNLSAGAKYSVQDAQAESALQNVAAGATAGALIAGPIGAVVGGIAGAIGEKIRQSTETSGPQESDKTVTEKLAMAMANGELDNPYDEGQIAEYLTDELGVAASAAEKMAKELADNAEELIDFGRTLNTAEQQMNAYYEGMAQNAASMVDTAKMTSEQATWVQNAATADYGKAFVQEELEDLEALDNKEQKKILKEYAEAQGYTDVKVNGDKVKYTDAEGNEQEVSVEYFKQQYAAAEATEEMTKALEQLPKTIEKVSSLMGKEAGKAFKAMYAGKEGSAMTKSDIEAVKGVSGMDLKETWFSLSQEEKSAYANYDDFANQFKENQKVAEERLAKAEEAAKNAGIEVMDGITMEAAEAYAEQMRNIYLLNEQSAAALDTNLQGVIDNLNDTDKTKFMSALNALDWSDVDSIESLPETLEQIGVSVPEKELEAYLDQLKEVGNATKKIDLAKLTESLSGLLNLKKGIESGEQGRAFSEEAYNAIKEMSPELAKSFQLGLDGQYTYLGSSMEELTLAIEENTIALLEQAQQELRSKVEMGELATEITYEVEGVEYDMTELVGGGADEETKKKALKEFQQEMIDAGMEITGIAGFGNYSSVDKLSGDELDNIFAQLTTISNNTEKYSSELKESVVSAMALAYQSNSAVENATAANAMDSQYATWDTVKGAINNIAALFDKNREKIDLDATRGTSTSYAKATRAQREEFDARSAALMSQGTAAGVSPQILDQYAKVVEAYKEGRKEYGEVLKIQRQLANTTDYLNMRKGLTSVFETIKGIREEYDLIADGDAVSKINTANQALAKFGLTATSEEEADAYMKLLDQVSQGNTEAIAELVGFAQNAAGLSTKAYGNAFTTEWNNLGVRQKEFYDQMAEASLGYWEKTEDGQDRFVWATESNFASAAKAAGTAFEAWENAYDVLYNLNEELNGTLRERERLERSYQRAVDGNTKSAQELANITAEQLLSLQEEANLQKEIAKTATQNIANKQAENAKYTGLYSIDAKTGAIMVDNEAVANQNFSAEEGAEFKEFITYLKEQTDIAQDAADRIDEINDEVSDIKKRGKDSNTDIYNKVKEGLVKQREEEIERLQTINDSINEAQTALVGAIQEQIEADRQAREQEKAAQEITDKEARLAYLMQDTSGGNALEIASLQKEIAEAKESYNDSLIDQSIENLQAANEKAAEQREQQIEIAQSQLEEYANSTEIWTEVKTLVDQGYQAVANGVNFSDTAAGALAQFADDVKTMNPFEKQDFIDALDTSAKEGAIYQGFVKVAGTDENPTTIGDLSNNITGSITGMSTEITSALDGIGNGEVEVTNEYTINVEAFDDFSTEAAINEKIAMKKRYATGGLADFTGPAWLDGTKSKPEIVLNQQDSANFIQLRDILAELLGGSSSLGGRAQSQKGGDNYYDIAISVESLSNDYDVEQLADKIRSMLYEDATYRNVNALSQ